MLNQTRLQESHKDLDTPYDEKRTQLDLDTFTQTFSARINVSF